MSDLSKYNKWKERQEDFWESLCSRCGYCCGALDDPCEHLRKNKDGFFCDIYKNRFGEHRTVSGKKMKCVPIRTILHESWSGDEHCSYKKYIQSSQSVRIYKKG